MERFVDFEGVVAPYPHDNVDTDQIIPKQFLTSLTKTGYGLFLFNADRWMNPATSSDTKSDGLKPNPGFILNKPKYKDASILVAGRNFGCGSSREHAVWALMDYGFKTIIAPGFADIFSSNASKNGLLLVKQPIEIIEQIWRLCDEEDGFSIAIALKDESPHIVVKGKSHPFEIDPGIRERLLSGIDEIAVTELVMDKIKDYEARRKKDEPWLDIGTDI